MLRTLRRPAIGLRYFLLCVAAASSLVRAADAVRPSDHNDPNLKELFQTPPPAYRPLVITHSAAIDNPNVLPWLGQLRSGGAVVDAGIKPGSPNVGPEPWNNPTYLDDPEQFAKLRKVIADLRQTGKHVWIYDELGYPSASAGGRVVADHPEFQVQVVACRSARAKPGETAAVRHERGTVVACQAIQVREGNLMPDRIVDLAMSSDNTFSYRAAEGEWIVCLFERFPAETWRRHNIPRRNVNILDRQAIARFVQLTHDRYAKELGAQLRDVEAFFTDEPQFGSAEHWSEGLPSSEPMVQWCDELPAAFQQKKGYDIKTALPALFHSAGAATARHRYNFYDVQSDLVAENFFGQIEDWCHAHGVASSGHMLLEESLLFHLMFSGSMMKNWARMDLPGVDLLGASPYHTMAGWNHNIVPVAEDYSCKMASSVAHLSGKIGTFTESYAVADQATLRQVLGIAAWQFAGGITHMSTYSIQQQLPAADYATFSDFAGRLAVMARRGRHVADVAVLVPETSVWASYTPPDGGLFHTYFKSNPEPTRIDQVFRETCCSLLRRQRDFDCLSEPMLQHSQIRDGQLQLANESFRCLILPEMRMIEEATLAKVRQLVEAGVQVVFVGSLPRQSPAKGDDPDITRACESLLREFPDRVAHHTKWTEPTSLADLLEQKLPASVRWSGADSVRLMRRSEAGREILLIANPGHADASGQLHLPVDGTVTLWDPESGKVEPATERAPNSDLPVHVPAQSARFVVVERVP